MVVRSDSVFLSELTIHPFEPGRDGGGAAASPVRDNPVTVFRGLAFGIAFQVVPAAVGYGLWHVLRPLF